MELLCYCTCVLFSVSYMDAIFCKIMTLGGIVCLQANIHDVNCVVCTPNIQYKTVHKNDYTNRLHTKRLVFVCCWFFVVVVWNIFMKCDEVSRLCKAYWNKGYCTRNDTLCTCSGYFLQYSNYFYWRGIYTKKKIDLDF